MNYDGAREKQRRIDKTGEVGGGTVIERISNAGHRSCFLGRRIGGPLATSEVVSWKRGDCMAISEEIMKYQKARVRAKKSMVAAKRQSVRRMFQSLSTIEIAPHCSQ